MKLQTSNCAVLVLSLSAALMPNNVNAEAKDHANILFFISDQLSWQALATYGADSESTPTVDSLGRNGVAFSQAYTVCPLSMPARAALWTGQYPHVTKVESNGRNWKNPPVPDELQTMGEIFSSNGYECVHFGKQHDSGTLRGFNNEPDNITKIINEYDEYPLTRDSYMDVYTIDKTLAYFDSMEESERPFFCVVDINNPHNICDYIGQFRGEHENPTFPGELPDLPDNFNDPYVAERPHPVQYLCCTHNRQAQASHWSPENYQHYLAAYYYYANRMDRDVKRVLYALKRSGNADNTLIVFMADHGEGMAAKRMVTKQGTPYDQTTRVPLIFAGKGVERSKKTIDKPLVNVSLDMIPTLCEYAGIETPKSMPGESMLGWISGTQKKDDREYICTEWTTEWGYTVSPFRMIRTHGYKYVKYLEDGAEELFDMRRDSLEMINLVSNDKFKSVLEQHREYLKEHIANTDDNFYSRKVHWDPRVANHKVGYQNHVGDPAPMLK